MVAGSVRLAVAVSLTGVSKAAVTGAMAGTARMIGENEAVAAAAEPIPKDVVRIDGAKD